jgi:hypothetical protein
MRRFVKIKRVERGGFSPELGGDCSPSVSQENFSVLQVPDTLSSLFKNPEQRTQNKEPRTKNKEQKLKREILELSFGHHREGICAERACREIFPVHQIR